MKEFNFKNNQNNYKIVIKAESENKATEILTELVGLNSLKKFDWKLN